MHPRRDHHLPLDPAAYRAVRPARGRVIVIAPTRAACETIELALGARIDTLIQREYGPTLAEWASAGEAFGIVAGTGTGKTMSIRTIAEALLGESLRYGVVNREREATPETPSWNVIVVTTGIARRWFQDDLITGRDTIVADEIHQTSAELELCLALGKRAGCRFIWLSATVDPAFYAAYLQSAHVLETSAFDPALKAHVEVTPLQPKEFLDDRTLRRLVREGRGVAVFVPTRAEVEQLAADIADRWPRLNAAFYHGGQPIRIMRPFLEGTVPKPFLLAMTAAGQSALNIPGLDTVVIYDARYGNVVDRGRNVLHRLYLGPNEILQMAGRVHGRVPDGQVTILSDRDLAFDALRPGPPDFQLAGDAERVALTCAALGVDASDLDLPVPLDRVAYRRAVRTLVERGIIDEDNGRLTAFGRAVEAMPVERPWGELLVRAEPTEVPMVAVCANIDSLHRMTREERNLSGAMVKGSDHLTTYNLYAEALQQHGYLGEVFGLPRHLFTEGLDTWAERRGVLVKAIEDAALGTAAVYRSLELPLPAAFPLATRAMHRGFADLLGEVASLDVVLEGASADGTEVRVSRTSVAESWGAVAGTIRYFADRFGTPRASIEGTTLDPKVVRRHARWGPGAVVLLGPRKNQIMALRRTLRYAGFELETTHEPVKGAWPVKYREEARRLLAEALLEGGTMHDDGIPVRRAVRELRELYRRSGGVLREASDPALLRTLEHQLRNVESWSAFLATPLTLDPDAIVTPGIRAELGALPSMVRLFGDAAPLEYEVQGGQGIVRLRLREGQARRLDPNDLPPFDRPLRFAVTRSHGNDLHADTLGELWALMDRERRGRQRYAEKGSGGSREGRAKGRGEGRGKGRGKGRGRRR